MLCRLLFCSTGSPTSPRQPLHKITTPRIGNNGNAGNLALPSCGRAMTWRGNIAAQLEMVLEREALAVTPNTVASTLASVCSQRIAQERKSGTNRRETVCSTQLRGFDLRPLRPEAEL